jgi:hypothetical protein
MTGNGKQIRLQPPTSGQSRLALRFPERSQSKEDVCFASPGFDDTRHWPTSESALDPEAVSHVESQQSDVSRPRNELFGSPATITAVKTAIPWGFLVLIPALAAAGGTGFTLSKGRRVGLIGTNMKRARTIAANGILVLIPSALFLAAKARAAEFDNAFSLVQALELAGARESLPFAARQAWPQLVRRRSVSRTAVELQQDDSSTRTVGHARATG